MCEKRLLFLNIFLRRQYLSLNCPARNVTALAVQALKAIHNLTYVFRTKVVKEVQLPIRNNLGNAMVRHEIPYKKGATTKYCNAPAHREWEQQCLFSKTQNVECNIVGDTGDHVSRNASKASAVSRLLHITYCLLEHKIWNLFVLFNQFYCFLMQGRTSAYILGVSDTSWPGRLFHGCLKKETIS